MVTRTALLYLSRQHAFKGFLSRVPGFKQVTRRFIAGENIDDAIEAIRQLNALGITASFDHLGESISSPAEAEADVREYLHVLSRIERTGINSNVSVKPTQLGLDIDEHLCLRNIQRIVEAAAGLGNFVRIDMEGSAYTERTLNLFYELFQKHRNVGIVIQAYLHRSEQDIRKLIELGRWRLGPEDLGHLLLAEGTALVASWYGVRPVTLPLGGEFHRRRLAIRSTQVSTIPARLAGVWTRDRRRATARRLLDELPLQVLATHLFPFDDAAAGYATLARGEPGLLHAAFDYRSSGQPRNSS